MKELSRSSELANAFAKKMSSEEYHAHKAISKSGLDRIHRSPMHFKEWQDNPPEQTPAMIFGSLVHDALLLPEHFKATTALMPEIDRRTKAGKEAFEKFTIENHGKRILSHDEYQTIQAMLDSVYSHPTAGKLLDQGHAEQSFFWTDPETQVECRCRPDFQRDGKVIVDLKTTEDASFRAFQKSIGNFRYDVQAAFYADGLSAVTGQTFDTFVLIAVEKKAPFAVAVYALDEASIECGRMKYKSDLSVFAECLKTNQWPGYPIEVQPMNLPSWAFEVIE